MSGGSEDGEISESREFIVDDDSLDIKPPQNQAGSKHKSRSKHSDHKRRDKHKHRRDKHESRRQRREHRERRDGHREPDPHRGDARDADLHRGDSHRAEPHRDADPYRGEPHREADPYRGEPHREADPYRGEPHRPLSVAHRPPPEQYDAHEHRSRDRRERPSRRERRGERTDREPAPAERLPYREPPQEPPPPARDAARERGGDRHRPERRAEPSESDRRSERLLLAVRESEYQKEMSKRELEARRQRRELEKQRHRELRQIEAKREREYSDDRDSDRRKRSRRDRDRDGREPEETEREQRRSPPEAKEKPPEEEEEQSSEEEDDDDEDDSDSSSSESEEEEEEDEREEGEDSGEEEAPEPVRRAVSRSPTPPVAGSRWRQTSRSSPEPARSPGGSSPPRSPSPVLAAASPPDSPLQLKEVLPPYLPAIQGCRNVEEFNCLNRIEEGTYGVVYRAVDKRTKEIVALKRLKMENEKEGFPITSLREINTLLKAQHENIVTVREIVVGSNMDKIYIVMDYVEHDLKSLMQTMKAKKQSFTTGEVKCLLMQMLRAVRHLHDNWILHRDLKTSNLLLSHKGVLKVGDFGLAREYGSPLKAYTPIVVTLWYRAPELLLGVKEYSCPIDMWSVGCIFGELVRMEPMFPGKSEADQINRIFKELGTPNDKIWPGYSELPAIKKMTFTEYPYNQLANKLAGAVTEKGVALMNKLLTYDPKRRLTAEEALSHSYFEEQPRPIDRSMFPTWPAKSEQGHRKTGSSPKPPSGRKNLGDEDVGFQLGAAAGAGGFSLKF